METHNSGTYQSNFWDSEASNQSTATGATGVTTSDMKTPTTFTAAGWDFMAESVNGTEDHWGINTGDNQRYPFLKWQEFKLQVDDNCQVASVENSFNSSSSLDGAEFPAGITSVVWTVTDEAGNQTNCSFDVTVNPSTTGINTRATGNIFVYPNPSGDEISIVFEGSSANRERMHISVTDITGKMYLRETGEYVQNHVIIDISGLDSGIYLLRINHVGGIFTHKIVKE